MSEHDPERPGFLARNRDALALEAIGGLLLALVVSGVMFGVEEARSSAREAHDESLNNSLFVRQAVMNGAEVLPFSALYLEGTQLSGLALAGADLSDADLAGAELKDTDLTGADLSEADLTGADLSGAVLAGAMLAEAVLVEADVTGADFTGADLTGSRLDGAYYGADEPPAGLGDDVLARLTALNAADEDVD